MIADLKSDIKFLRHQVACNTSSNTYIHEEIKFLSQQLETALSKQEHLNIGFCNNRHGKHIPSNVVNSDEFFRMTNYFTKVTGIDSNM